MARSGMVEKLNTQLHREYSSSHLCLQLSRWCVEQNLNGTAAFLRHQAQNNVTHMMRVFEYMKKAGANPVIARPVTAGQPCASLEELFQLTLEDLQQRSSCLARLVAEANSVNDRSTVGLLKALAEEQQEDSLLLQSLLDEIRCACHDGHSAAEADRLLLAKVNKQLQH